MLTAETLTTYIQDDPRFNLLLDNKEQFSEDTLDFFIENTYKETSALVPALRGSEKKIPDIIILHGALSNIFRSEQFKELRNQLQYSDSNLSSISVFHKAQDYGALSAGLKQEFITMLKDISIANFIQSAWGSSTSNSEDMEMPFAFSGNMYFGFM